MVFLLHLDFSPRSNTALLYSQWHLPKLLRGDYRFTANIFEFIRRFWKYLAAELG
jgi:hypothetical protein